MFESICTVGERGQITIPKIIRQVKGIRNKDKLIIRMDNEKMVLEKMRTKQGIEEGLKEYHTKYFQRDLEICKDWKKVDKEMDAMIDDY